MPKAACAGFLHAHSEAWQSATVHPFLQQCQQGTLVPAQFNTWLVQDYLFVIEFTRFAGRLLAAAPVAHFDTLLGGLTVIKDELQWFESKAQERGLAMPAAMQPTCQAYCLFMQGLMRESYAVQAVAFWAIERAYNQGWQGHSPMPEPYTEFGDRWGNERFTDYVGVLEQQANSALALATDAELARAEKVVLEVARLEKDFWQMAFAAAD